MKRRVTKEELLLAQNKVVTDVIDYDLRVLFCGINPGLYTAVVGHHFARPGNRFWRALHFGGFTNRVLSADEERELLRSGYGITNLVERATATAAELTSSELAEGGKRLVAKVERFRPQWLAVLGIGAYRTAFARPHAQLGRQNEKISGALLWVLPNPSGLNAHYQINDLAKQFGELRGALGDNA